MKHLLILPAIAGAFLLTSCELEEQIEPAEEAYTKAFIKEFGIIDPNQDWNMATRGSVTVKTPSATEVKVYGLVDGEYRLMGDFGDVSGTQTLQFDMLRGVSDILVSNGSSSVQTTVGGNAALLSSKTRATTVWNGKEENSYGIKVEKTTTYEQFTSNDVDDGIGVYEYRKTLPEKKYNGGKVTQNFHFVSDGKPFVIYPVYWQTSATPEYGIAIKQTDGTIAKVPVYTIKSGDEMQYKVPGTRTTAGSYGTNKFYSINNTDVKKPYEGWPFKVYMSDFTQEERETLFKWITETYDAKSFNGWESLSYTVDEEAGPYTTSFTINGTSNGESVSKGYTLSALTNESNYPFAKDFGDFTEEQKDKLLTYLQENYFSEIDGSDWMLELVDDWSVKVTYDAGTWTNVGNGFNSADGGTSTSADESKSNYEYRSLGIQITVPENKEFAFYCKNGDKYMYSVQEWNDDPYGYDKDGDGVTDTWDATLGKGVHGATFLNNKGERCIAFEDWHNDSNGDVDLNDGVFYTTLATTGGNESKIVNEDAQSYIIAAEDLGNMDDFDFNDMVIKVTTPTLKSGTTDTYELKVKVLAAGGTLPLKICRNDEALTDNSNNDEIHAMFGVATGTMVNTDNGTVSKDYIDLKTIELTAEQKETFTITSQSVDETNKKQLTKMGGFSFIVDRGNDGTFTTTTEITAPDNGTAPQMMCLPDTWKWPKERVRINTAYKNFEEWGGNYSSTEWLNNVDNNSVVTK